MPEALLRSPKTLTSLLGRKQNRDLMQAQLSKTEKVNELSAGYMELAGSKKDGGCRIVDVQGGISKDLGCCNLFKPESAKTSRFSCGTCHYED
jgi:hypothetical protein